MVAFVSVYVRKYAIVNITARSDVPRERSMNSVLFKGNSSVKQFCCPNRDRSCISKMRTVATSGYFDGFFSTSR